MPRPDLYRSGNSKSSAGFKVRFGVDIKTEGDYVLPDTGGVSTFSRQGPTWKYPFVLKSSATISSNLKAVNDHGTHYGIEPTKKMSKSQYEADIRQLNSIAQYIGGRATTTDTGVSDILSSLPRFSTLPSKDIRFIANALAAVYHDCTPISDWDENDYTYIGVIAAEMNAGNLQLDSLMWQGSGYETTKTQRFVAQALASHVKAERDVTSKRALNSKDGQDVDEAQAELDNDHTFLLSILGLDNDANPLSTYV